MNANRRSSFKAQWHWLVSLCIATSSAFAADFNVTSPGSSYTINGGLNNPVLTLFRGETYTFAISTSSTHPFFIVSPAGTTTSNNISSGTITFRVPTNAANYSYRCSIHGFGNTIVTIPPPSVRIVKMDVGTNLVLRSTGTNNWILTPQFSTNLGGTNWFALTVQSNRFLNGTNETFCGRPPVTNAFIRVRAQRN
jgi:hypothetical protein